MSAVPYVCSKCKAEGVKLWRQYNTFVNHLELLCGPCACEDQADQAGKPDADSIDESGRRPLFIRGEACGTTDQIGSLVPAVPTDDGETFWGYTSVPVARVAWWRALPLRAS